MPNRVRAADINDATGIAGVHVRSWQHAYRGHIPDTVLDTLDIAERARQWQKLIYQPHHIVRVATRDGIVQGFVSMIPSRDPGAPRTVGEIAALYVDPPAWRSGLGRMLIAAAREAADQAGYSTLTLWVLESNAPARRFYEKMNFAADGAAKLDKRPGYTLNEVRYSGDCTP